MSSRLPTKLIVDPVEYITMLNESVKKRQKELSQLSSREGCVVTKEEIVINEELAGDDLST